MNRPHEPKPSGPKDVQKKLILSFGLYAMAWKIKRHQLAKQFPEVDDRELDSRCRDLFEKAS